MPPIPEPPEPLLGERVRLRPAAPWDIPEILIAYQDDPALHRRLGQERAPSGAELGRRAEQAAGARTAGVSLTLTITEPEADECVGQVHAQAFDWDHRRAELAIWVAPQVRGQGRGSQALSLVSRWLLAACRLARLQLLTHLDNEPMLLAAAAAGYVQEGVLRGYERERERGRRVDVVILSLLASDP